MKYQVWIDMTIMSVAFGVKNKKMGQSLASLLACWVTFGSEPQFPQK
jgi:hypothetical protein